MRPRRCGEAGWLAALLLLPTYPLLLPLLLQTSAAVDHNLCAPPPRWGERRGEGRCKCTSPSLNLAHTSISRLETRRPLAGLGGDGAGGDEAGGNEQVANEQAAIEEAVIEEAVTGGDWAGVHMEQAAIDLAAMWSR